MSRMKTVFFDLDGTLWPPQGVVIPAYRLAFQRLGRPVPDDETLFDTMGYPNTEIWQRLLPDASSEERLMANELMGAAEQEVLKQGLGRPFPGVKRTLERLREQAVSLNIISNCDRHYLQAVPDMLGIGEFFDQRFCAGDYPNLSKAEILRKVLPKFASPAAMVGDRHHDVEAGLKNGLLTIGCLFGFGKVDEFSGADHLVNSFEELLAVLT